MQDCRKENMLFIGYNHKFKISPVGQLRSVEVALNDHKSVSRTLTYGSHFCAFLQTSFLTVID